MPAILLAAFLVVFVWYFLIWIVAEIIDRWGIIDVGWGLSFIIISFTALIVSSEPATYLDNGLVALVMLWGLRLSWHIGRRFMHSQQDDWRYVEMRRNWGKWQALRGLLQVFWLQAVLAWVITLPAQAALANADTNNTVLIGVGAVIWFVGYGFEVVADAQLRRFKAQSKNKGKLLTSGLRGLTRYPNYFGEATLWFGFWLIALAAGAPLWTAIGPLLIFLLVRYVSGVPLLEKKFMKNPQYRAYARRTPIFFPVRLKSR